MLTTYDLYTKTGYNFEVNDLVKFQLLRGYKLKIFSDDSKRVMVEKSKNKNSNQAIIGKITNYKPWTSKQGDLEIELIGTGKYDNYEILLKLSQCKNLDILS